MYCTAPLSPRKGRLRSFRDDDDDDDDDGGGGGDDDGGGGGKSLDHWKSWYHILNIRH